MSAHGTIIFIKSDAGLIIVFQKENKRPKVGPQNTTMSKEKSVKKMVRNMGEKKKAKRERNSMKTKAPYVIQRVNTKLSEEQR